MSKFKSGDLVMICGALSLNQNIGRVGELTEFLMPGQIFKTPSGIEYEYEGKPSWVIVGEEIAHKTSDGVRLGFGVHQEKSLIRLEPDAIPASEVLVTISL